MSTIAFDAGIFREQVPAYASEVAYPDSALGLFWDAAICWVSDSDAGTLSGDCRRRAINLMMAHLIYIQNLVMAGTTPGTVTASTVDKASVTLLAPPVNTTFQFWLTQSPYGMQLLSLLRVNGAGGMYIGANRARMGFRQPNGGFIQ